MNKRIIIASVITLAAFCGFGFIISPKPKPLEINVTTRIEMIGGHQYAIAISSTTFGYEAKSSITMVHHEGCTACARNRDVPKPPRRRPPVALPYEGQF